MNGKGSARRPTDEKAYAENWERVFKKERFNESEASDRSLRECKGDSMCSNVNNIQRKALSSKRRGG